MTDEVVADFYLALQREEEKPQGKDPFVRSYAQATQHLLYDRDPQLLSFYNEGLELRQTVNRKPWNSEVLLNVGMRVFLKGIIAKHQDFPTKQYSTPAFFVSAIREVLDDPKARAEAVFDMTRDVQSNVVNRYALAKLIMVSERQRLGQEVRMLDIGSSAMNGPSQIARNLPFDRIIFGEINPAFTTPEGPVMVPDPSLTGSLNHAIAEPLSLRGSYGVDAVPIDQKQNYEWMMACSHRPVERFGSNLESFEDYMQTSHLGLSFYLGELSTSGIINKDETGAQAELPKRSFDVVTIFTTGYQQPRTLKRRLLEVANDYTRPSGLVIIQDYARANRRGGLDFVPQNKWRTDYTNRTFVSGLRGDQISEVFRGRNGRQNEVAKGENYDDLAIASETI
jgi:hypothetical protein